MGVVYILLLIQGITGEMVLYQPQNIVFVEVNRTAVISCVSGDKSIGTVYSWYHKKWGSSEAPVQVKSCSSDNDLHKYVCKKEKYTSWLEIYNVQITDTGVYYCMHGYSFLSRKFGHGTQLNVGDKSTSRSSIHIIGHLQLYSSSLMLACVVLSAHNTVHLYWNISGTYHKGQIISREESDGTWTVMNFISFPKVPNWNHGEKVTCEVWIKSSPTSVHWEISGKDELHGFVPSKCQSFLIPLVIVGTLLLLALTINLKTLNDKKTRALTGQSDMTEDEITYAELNINHLTRLKK